jgi:hypothetical protein
MNVIPPIATRPHDSPEPKDQETTMLIDNPATANSVPKIITPFEFLAYVAKNPSTLEFVYMIPTRKSKKPQGTYNPYDLEVVDFFEIDTKSPEGYYTLSAKVNLLDLGCDPHQRFGPRHFHSVGAMETRTRPIPETTEHSFFLSVSFMEMFHLVETNSASYQNCECKKEFEQKLIYFTSNFTFSFTSTK